MKQLFSFERTKKNIVDGRCIFPTSVCLPVQILQCKTNRRANFGASNATLLTKRTDPIGNCNGRQTKRL